MIVQACESNLFQSVTEQLIGCGNLPLGGYILDRGFNDDHGIGGARWHIRLASLDEPGLDGASRLKPMEGISKCLGQIFPVTR